MYKEIIFMATQQEVIQAFMKSLDNSKKSGEESLDEAIKKLALTSKVFRRKKATHSISKKLSLTT